MRITCLPASVAVFALTLAACQPQPSPTPAATPEAAPSALPEADAAALRALLDRWQQAARAKDWPAVAATYTEDGMFMPPKRAVRQGPGGNRGVVQGVSADVGDHGHARGDRRPGRCCLRSGDLLLGVRLSRQRA